jgi:hypothetical protein
MYCNTHKEEPNMHYDTKGMNHEWNTVFCSCGQDVVTCQHCGKQVCGDLTEEREARGNKHTRVCWLCAKVV